MLLTRRTIVTAVLLTLTLAGLGAGLAAYGPFAVRQADARPAARKAREDDPPPAAKRPVDRAELAKNRLRSRENLKKLALAMHAYADDTGHLPPPAIYSGEGKRPAARPGGPGMMPGGGRPGGMPGPGVPGAPGGMRPPGVGGPSMPRGGGGGMPGRPARAGKALLSWRVALLPYLGEKALYKQFKLNEAWDSPHNKKLLKKMPKVYAPPGVTTSSSTFYQVFVGPGAAFEKHQALWWADFFRGTANTILIVEAGTAVPWTKPVDLHFAADEPLPDLGGLFPGLIHAAFADGKVHSLSAKYDPALLRRAILREGGPVDLSLLKTPAGRILDHFAERNEHLKEELKRQRERLEEMRQEKKALEEVARDPLAQKLTKENAALEKQVRELREQAERLRKEVERLKKGGKARKKEEEE
jgi:hypothetical protein